MSDPARSIVEMSAWMHDAAARIHPALRNLREVQPGFPSTTPGSGGVGGGSGSSDTIVERLALTGGIDNDDAVRDLAQLRELIRQVEPRLRAIHDLTLRWGYRRPGDYDPGAPTPRPRATETASASEKWCTSCARINVAEPVGEKGRAGRCRWCSDFHAAHKQDPPIQILNARHRGIRINQSLIDAALRRTPDKKKRKAHR